MTMIGRMVWVGVLGVVSMNGLLSVACSGQWRLTVSR